MPDEFRSARCGYNFIRGLRDFIRELARQENGCFANAEIGRPFLRFVYAAHQRCIFIGRKISIKSGAKSRIHVMTAGQALYQKLAFPHYLLAIKPDIKIATDTVDVRF